MNEQTHNGQNQPEDLVDHLAGELRVALDLIRDLEEGGGYFYDRRRSIIARLRRKLNELQPEIAEIVMDIECIGNDE